MKWLAWAIVVLTLIGAAVWLSTKRGATGVVKQKSDSIGTLAERVAFLERHVTFRRKYEALDFDVFVARGDQRGVPGPSEWDVRVVAVVPEEDMGTWVPTGVKA